MGWSLLGIIGDLLGLMGFHVERRQGRGAAMSFALITFVAALTLIVIVWLFRS
jgi:hypothetical protein